jgi:hypothetical protein
MDLVQPYIDWANRQSGCGWIPSPAQRGHANELLATWKNKYSSLPTEEELSEWFNNGGTPEQNLLVSAIQEACGF